MSQQTSLVCLFLFSKCCAVTYSLARSFYRNALIHISTHTINTRNTQDKTVILWSVRPLPPAAARAGLSLPTPSPSTQQPGQHRGPPPPATAQSNPAPTFTSLASFVHSQAHPSQINSSSNAAAAAPASGTSAPSPSPALWTTSRGPNQQQQQPTPSTSGGSTAPLTLLHAEAVLKGHEQPVRACLCAFLCEVLHLWAKKTEAKKDRSCAVVAERAADLKCLLGVPSTCSPLILRFFFVQVAFVTWSPDDQLLLTVADEVVRLWQVCSGRLLHTLT